MSDYEQPTTQPRRRSRVERNRLAEQNESIATEVYSSNQMSSCGGMRITLPKRRIYSHLLYLRLMMPIKQCNQSSTSD